MSLANLSDDPVLAGQMANVDEMVTQIRPLTIVHERDALRSLLQTFVEDPERAVSVAAFAVIELAKLRTAEMAGDTRDDVVDAAEEYIEAMDDPSDADRRDDQRRLYAELRETVRFHREGTVVAGLDGERP